MANYIHTLQAKVAELEADKAAADAALMDLYRYLGSDKFREDTTVQVSDVLWRLQDVRTAVMPS